MTRGDISRKVQVVLEELSPFNMPQSLIASAHNDVQPVVSYIQDNLDKAYDDVLLGVPLHVVRLTSQTPLTSPSPVIAPNPLPTISVGKSGIDAGVGVISQPDDYLRLHTIKVSSWERGLNSAISSESVMYAKERNPYTRGGKVKPVAVINKNTIELYSCAPADTLATFLYFKKTATNTTAFADELTELLVRRCSVRILEIFEQYDKAKVLSDEYSTLIQAITI